MARGYSTRGPCGARLRLTRLSGLPATILICLLLPPGSVATAKSVHGNTEPSVGGADARPATAARVSAGQGATHRTRSSQTKARPKVPAANSPAAVPGAPAKSDQQGLPGVTESTPGNGNGKGRGAVAGEVQPPGRGAADPPALRVPPIATVPVAAPPAPITSVPIPADSPRARSPKEGAGRQNANGSGSESERPTLAIGPRVSDASASRRPDQTTETGNAGVGVRGGGDVRSYRSVVVRAVRYVPAAIWAALGVLSVLVALLLGVSAWGHRRLRWITAESLVDQLTGIANRRSFDQAMTREWKLARRHDRPIGVVFVDIDGFKAYNDARGHLGGDEILREVATILADSTRDTDIPARFGGDEFAVICPEMNADGLDRLSERIHRASRERGLPVALSIGSAIRERSDGHWRDTIARADFEMYAVKDRAT